MSVWLMRSSKREFLEKMQKEGELHMRCLKYYCDCEDKDRRDKLETASYIEYLSPDEYPYMILNPEQKNEVKIKLKNASLITHGYQGYVFCMHHLSEKHIDDKFSIDLKDEALIFVTDTVAFLDRFVAAVEKLDLKYAFGVVKYIDLDNYTGNKNPFQKHHTYHPEQEYRLFIPTTVHNEVLKIYIGDISDISNIVDVHSKGLKQFMVTSLEKWEQNNGSGVSLPKSSR
jgi:hypothetical protein